MCLTTPLQLVRLFPRATTVITGIINNTSMHFLCLKMFFTLKPSLGKNSYFQPFSSHGTHKLITKILQHPKKYIFCQDDKKVKGNFDSFTPDGYCCVGCCHFLTVCGRGPHPPDHGLLGAWLHNRRWAVGEHQSFAGITA